VRARDAKATSRSEFTCWPDIPVPLTALAELRDFWRRDVKKSGLGMVSVDILPIHGVPTIRTVFKVPERPHGRIIAYLGALTLPFADFSYVVKVECRERFETGLRLFDPGSERSPGRSTDSGRSPSATHGGSRKDHDAH
jgi:hypothetical protein